MEKPRPQPPILRMAELSHKGGVVGVHIGLVLVRFGGTKAIGKTRLQIAVFPLFWLLVACVRKMDDYQWFCSGIGTITNGFCSGSGTKSTL